MKVKSLRDYIEKIANAKKNNLKHLNDADNIDVSGDLIHGVSSQLGLIIFSTQLFLHERVEVHL